MIDLTPQFLFGILHEGNFVYVKKDRLLSLSYNENYKGKVSASITLNNDDGALLYVSSLLKKNVHCEISFGYHSSMRGPIPLVSNGFPTGGSTLTVELRGKLDKGGGKTNSRSWFSVELSKIVEQLAIEMGFANNVTDDVSGIVIESLTQSNETNLGFLNRIASMYGRNIWANETGLHFEKPGKNSETPSTILKKVDSTIGGGNIKDYSIVKTIGRLPKSIKISGIDPKTKAIIEHTIQVDGDDVPEFSGTPIFDDDDNVSISAYSNDSQTMKQEAIKKMTEAKIGAVQMKLDLFGVPLLMANKKTFIEGLHNTLDGVWFVRDVTHSVSPGTMNTDTTLGREGYRRKKRKKKDDSFLSQVMKYGVNAVEDGIAVGANLLVSSNKKGKKTGTSL